ncbi:phage major capsid protein, P2 family [Escherichia coli]|uniref:phage major capsid protein, P2 family n=134 Tax=cellular organisms TaxID=131567 RepID=UPI003965C6A8
MKKNTRFAFNAYLQQLARLNGVAVEELSSKFTVEPSVQQTLEDQIQQSAAFLTLINVTPVTEQSGQLLGLGVGSTIAGTTDTTAKEREPVDPTLMVDVEYKCEQTNFDTVLTYAKLDLWAKFQDFQVRIRDAIVKRQALDRIMIGFNGVKRAKTSNRSENPLLQDVNKGWLQKIREDAPDHVMGSTTTGGETTPGAVKVGKGGEYANLDAVVMDAVNELIDVVYQDDDDLVVICGRELLSDKYFPLVNKEQENSEKLAADMIISQKRMGGLQAVRAPFFPPNALLITRLDNLSIYWQEDTRRRSVIDNPKRDRVENFESVNEAYVVEDYRCAALVENIQIGDFSVAVEAGATTTAAGLAMGAPVMAAVKSYTSMEDAMKGVAKQVNGLRDDNGNRTARFYEMQDAIKAASEQLPMENGAVDFAALVEGGARMNVANPDDSWEDQKRDLLAFASTAAKAATAFELPADELSESLGKIAQLYKIPTRNIEQLGDALNYLDDNAMSKGADIIDVMQRLGGVADRLDYRKAAALGSTFLTLGAAPEVAASAANAMVRELSIATMQSKSFFEGMNLLKLNPEVIEKQMTKDAMGTIQRVLENPRRKKAPR